MSLQNPEGITISTNTRFYIKYVKLEILVAISNFLIDYHPPTTAQPKKAVRERGQVFYFSLKSIMHRRKKIAARLFAYDA